MKIKSAGLTVIGKIRKNNEDNFYIDGYFKEDCCRDIYAVSCTGHRNCHVYAVCDGMGGYESGEEAAWSALNMLRRFDDGNIEDNLVSYVAEANLEIVKSAAENHEEKRGTTIALATVNDEHLTCCTVGDSRIYRFRDGKLNQISSDHTRVQNMINGGIITPEEAKKRKDIHVLSQYLGIPESKFKISPDIKSELEISECDIILLCSDGLTNMVSDGEMESIIDDLKNSSPKKIASKLAERAYDNGGVDNITVVIVKVER